MPVSPLPLLLMRVASTWSLPGLGLLALPDGATPPLATYDLHTALRIEAVLPGGTRHSGMATVEEITRASTPERGLLLEFSRPLVLEPGTQIWLVGEQPEITQ